MKTTLFFFFISHALSVAPHSNFLIPNGMSADLFKGLQLILDLKSGRQL